MFPNLAISLFSLHIICYQIVFFGIDNIHAMRDSLARLRAYLDTHGATSSDGMSSFLVCFAILYNDIIILPVMSYLFPNVLKVETEFTFNLFR